ncbi:MAG: hypothetical protein ACPL7D_09090 [Candidatus Sumerlaeaceae bacterium]
MGPIAYTFARRPMATLVYVVLLATTLCLARAQTDYRKNGRQEAPLHFTPTHPGGAENGGAMTGSAESPAPTLEQLCPGGMASVLSQSGIEKLAVQSEGMNYSLRT